MGGLGRFFCLGGGSNTRREWSPSGEHYKDPYGSGSIQTRLLEIVEQELDQRLGGANVPLQSVGSLPMRRLYNAGLPPQEMQLCKGLLSKIAALDCAREAAAEEKAQLAQALKAMELSHRQAEFSRAKAEALATARGEALMHAQAATKEAQKEQAQLSEMLKQALQQLGMAMTPGRSPGTPEGSMLTFNPPSPPPLALMQQPQQQQTPQNLRRRSQQQEQAGAHQQQQQQVKQRRSTDMRESTESQLSREFSGFTVYTNKLHDSRDDLEVEAPAAAASGSQQSQKQAEPAVADSINCGGEGALRQSGVHWRDMSSAVEASHSVDYESGRLAKHAGPVSIDSAGVGPLQQLQQRPTATKAVGGQVNSQQQQQMQRVARLALPALDASQLDSLVRIGAELPSPDMLMSPEVLSQLLPKLWDSNSNPVQSDGLHTHNVQQLLEQLQGGVAQQQQQQQQQAGAGRSSSGGQQGQPEEALRGSGGVGGLVGRAERKPAKAGTWLSPLKVGHAPRGEGEPTPSPQSHVKAVFREPNDLQFYLPFSAGLQKPHTAAKEEIRTRAAQAAGTAPSAAVSGRATAAAPPAALPSNSPLRPRQGAHTTMQAQPGRHARRASVTEAHLSSWDRAAQEQRQSVGSRQSLQSSADVRTSSGDLHAPLPGSLRASYSSESQGTGPAAAQQQPAAPTRKQQAFLSRFQPMGHPQLQPAGLGSVAASAGSGSRAPSREGSVDENMREGARAYYHQLPPQVDVWRQQEQKQQQHLGGSKSSSLDIAGVQVRSDGVACKQRASVGDSSDALLDSTNVGGGSSYLRKLAQQRVQQAYGQR